MTISLVTFSIKPGRVPDCRTSLRNAPTAPGLVAFRFVEIGVVNTIIAFCDAGDERAISLWARDRVADMREAAPLRGVSVDFYEGALPAGLADAPAVLLERPLSVGDLVPLSGEVGRGLWLQPSESLDAALAAAIALRRTSSAETALLIPEHL